MDLIEVRSVVRDMFWEWERDHLDDKECPICGGSCTMIKVSVGKGEEYEDKWRCLNCLGIFTEKLQKVE